MLTVDLIDRAGAALLEKVPKLLLDRRKRVFLLEFVVHSFMSQSVLVEDVQLIYLRRSGNCQWYLTVPVWSGIISVALLPTSSKPFTLKDGNQRQEVCRSRATLTLALGM